MDSNCTWPVLQVKDKASFRRLGSDRQSHKFYPVARPHTLSADSVNFRIFARHNHTQLRVKKIDKLILTSFAGPAILSYFVATFVLIMQFLWKYIDEILGKGLSIFELTELIFYYAVTLIPMAVPITVLISSVIVFGDMAEKYELSSMKSAGVSLIRIMLPAALLAVTIGLFSIFSANFLKPAALLQFNKRFLAIRKQKSALAIEEGIFNTAFTETVIRVNKIEKDKKTIHDVLIYDHSPNNKSLIGLTSAKGGKMYTVQEGRYFVMRLDSGIQYRELERKTNLGSSKSEIPFMRTYFDEWTVAYDMSQFDGEDGLLNFNRNKEDMLNSAQLLKSIDTFRLQIRSNEQKYADRIGALFSGGRQLQATQVSDITPQNVSRSTNSPESPALQQIQYEAPLAITEKAGGDSLARLRQVKDSLVRSYGQRPPPDKQKEVIPVAPKPYIDSMPLPKKVLIQQRIQAQNTQVHFFAETIDSANYRNVVVRAQNDLGRDRDELLTFSGNNIDQKKQLEKFALRLHQQYSWALVCVLFLFIGAPLGSIIRKGGYGYSLLVAILFYMIFIISTIFGEKLVKNETMTGVEAAWLPCLILLPFGMIVTILALRDIKLNPSIATTWIFEGILKIKQFATKKQAKTKISEN
ncbi:MAG: LptF/LptG family permease [Saprospiraceae bacterium]|nr:LptF/LptG family permease [Saprospiraceae bacterium]